MVAMSEFRQGVTQNSYGSCPCCDFAQSAKIEIERSEQGELLEVARYIGKNQGLERRKPIAGIASLERIDDKSGFRRVDPALQ